MQQAQQVDFSKFMPLELVRLIAAIDKSFKAVEREQPENTFLCERSWHPTTMSNGWTRLACGFLYIRLLSNGEMKLEIRSRNEKFSHPESWITHFSKPIADPNFFAELDEFLKRYFIDE